MQISSWLAGIVGGFISFAVISTVEGPARCRDGWHSTSIGKQGACSHHGGVGRSSAPIWSLLIGIGSAIVAARLQQRADANPNPTSPTEGVSGNPETLQPAAQLPRHIPPPVASKPPPLKSKLDAHFARYCTKCGRGMKAVRITVGDRPHGAFWECLNSGCGRTEPREEAAAPSFSELRGARRPKRGRG